MSKQTFRILRDHATDARLLAALVTFVLAERMFTGGLWVLTPASITGRIAALSTYPTVMAFVWMALALCVLPYTVSQAFNCWHAWRKPLAKCTCYVTLAGGVIWAYLAFLAHDLGFAYVTEIFVFDSLACVAMAAVIANSRNNEQARIEDGAA